MNKLCSDCYPEPSRHGEQWIGDILKTSLLPFFGRIISPKVEHRFSHHVTNALIAIGLVSTENPVPASKINSLSALVVKEAQGRGIRFEALRGPLGYLDYIRMDVGGRRFEFEKIPRAEFLETSPHSQIIDDKWKTKKQLERLGAPVSPGAPLLWFNRRKAERFVRQVDYPVVLKPRLGSLSQHVYTEIADRATLRGALRRSRAYSPLLLIEKQLSSPQFWRITVVDFDNLFIVKRSSCSVIGDGSSTIADLAKKKGIRDIHAPTVARQGFSPEDILQKGRLVNLHYKVIASLGAEFEEVDPKIIPRQNRVLFKKIARHFSSRLVGIDFAGEDIKKPWQEQKCAILELNSIPNLHLHTFKKGKKQENKVVEALVDLVEKYY